MKGVKNLLFNLKIKSESYLLILYIQIYKSYVNMYIYIFFYILIVWNFEMVSLHKNKKYYHNKVSRKLNILYTLVFSLLLKTLLKN